MRNRALHDALRDFALEAASLLTDELRDGAEIEFDVLDEGGGRGPALYRYRPRTAEFVAARWEELRALPACSRAGVELGAGASLWLRVNGMGGEQAEPALRAMLERLYEDSTSFGFPEERFDRLYEEVEHTLYRDAVRTCVLAPLRGVVMDCDRIDVGGGVMLVRGDRAELPPEASWAEDGPMPSAVVMLERDTSPDDPLRGVEVEAAAGRLVTAMRLLRPGAVSLAPVAWRRSGEGRHTALAIGGTHVEAAAARGGGETGGPRGDAWVLGADDADELRDLVRILKHDPLRDAPAWALRRFELGCAQSSTADALSDYLLALRSLLDATSDAGEASLALRVAALCAEEGHRRDVQHRVELAVGFEHFAMQGGGHLDAELRTESAPELVAELEGYLRALLRDILCGYLDSDLKGVADDILLESREPIEIAVRDLRVEPVASPVAEAVVKPAAEAVREAAYEASAASAPSVAHESREESIQRSEKRREWFEEPDERLAEVDDHPSDGHERYIESDPGYDGHDDFGAPDRDLETLDGRFDESDYRFDEADDRPGTVAEQDADTQEVPVLAVVPPSLDDVPIHAHRGDRFERPEPVDEVQQTFEGVTPSADWGFDDPEDFSAPI